MGRLIAEELTSVAIMSEWPQAVLKLYLMSHVVADTLLIYVGMFIHRDELMTSCRSSIIERICRRNACTSHADSCRIVVW